MIKNFSKLAIVAAAAAALPGVAQAGTSTATGTAVINIVSQCAVTGANVSLGSYTAAQTWNQVGAAVGLHDGTKFTAGSQGLEYLNFGSVTCDADVPYSLAIKGTGTNGTIKITHNSKVAAFLPAIKKIGGAGVADSSSAYAGTGAQVWTSAAAGKGNGQAQALLGNVTLDLKGAGATVVGTETLGVAGTAQDTLTYTLNF